VVVLFGAATFLFVVRTKVVRADVHGQFQAAIETVVSESSGTVYGPVKVVTIPGFGLAGQHYGLSGWMLFGPGVPSVPEGGTTVMLLGTALGALGMARRFLMSQPIPIATLAR
jgi:VPDSG-CTERM motif